MTNLLEKINSYRLLALANIDFVILAILLFIFFILLVKRVIFRFQTRYYAKIERLICKFEEDPWAFESFVADLYQSLGYTVQRTPGSGDRGKDILMSKGRHLYAVEVKLYAQERKVDREKIQKLHSAMMDCGADRGIFVTTSDFTDPALEYAAKFGIETVPGQSLTRLIKSRGLSL